jgi:hypothetical protein
MNLYFVLDDRSTFPRVRLITDDLRHALLEMGQEKSELRNGSRLFKVEGVPIDISLMTMP